MNPSRFLPLLLTLAVAFPNLAAAQPPAPQRRVSPALPGSSSSQDSSRPNLSTNFRLTLRVSAGDRKIGELSVLTAAPEIQLTGSLDADNVSSVSLAGELSEEEGHLVFRFHRLSASVPVGAEAKSEPQAPAVPAPSIPAGRMRNYQEASISGTVLVKPGRSYDLLKTGELTFQITVTPEPDK